MDLEATHPGRRVAVLVAHPDDETLWAGGLLLRHPEWSVHIVTLCRGSDPDRAPRFRRVLTRLGAQGAMGDLDDGPGQEPLDPGLVKATLTSLLPGQVFDLLITHDPEGEYTWHRRHGEVARAVHELWRQGQLEAGSLWRFAYEDGQGAYPPRPRKEAQALLPLAEAEWAAKAALITEVYGFLASSWEAKSAPRTEAFACSTRQPGQRP